MIYLTHPGWPIPRDIKYAYIEENLEAEELSFDNPVLDILENYPRYI